MRSWSENVTSKSASDRRGITAKHASWSDRDVAPRAPTLDRDFHGWTAVRDRGRFGVLTDSLLRSASDSSTGSHASRDGTTRRPPVG
jgi:hypothetical protein